DLVLDRDRDFFFGSQEVGAHLYSTVHSPQSTVHSGKRLENLSTVDCRCFSAQQRSAAKHELSTFSHQMSRFLTFSAFFSMNSRRGSTASPMRIEKYLSASTLSSTETWRRRRFSGFIVVSQSSS